MSTAATVHPGHQVFRTTPHPPPHIWVHPHDQSLQLLYLSLLQFSQIIKIKEITYDTHPPQRRKACPQAYGSEVV